MILDAPLIRRRRAELGLSVREVAKHLGVSGAVVTAIEAGTNHNEVSLAHLFRLAGVLAVESTTLLTAEKAERPSAGPTETPEAEDADAATVGALLEAAGVLTRLDVLCDALGWRAARLKVALDRLEERLPTVGLRLHRLHRAVRLTRASEPVPAAALAGVIRKHLNRAGMSLSEGRVLYRYVCGNRPTEPSNAEAVATGALANAALLVPAEENPNKLVIADEVRFSLLLDDEPAPDGAPRRRDRRSGLAAACITANNPDSGSKAARLATERTVVRDVSGASA